MPIPKSEVASILNYLAGARVITLTETQLDVWHDYLNHPLDRFDWADQDCLRQACRTTVKRHEQGQWVTVDTFARELDRIGNQRVSNAPRPVSPPCDPTVYCDWMVARAQALKRLASPKQAEEYAWSQIQTQAVED